MKKRYRAEQVVAMVGRADVGLGRGLWAPEACEQLGISEQTYYVISAAAAGLQAARRSGSVGFNLEVPREKEGIA